ncbi:hypothetical protein ALI44B_12725 [Leifsonia sp. ALI-44-B]|uniref:transporter substrate-binding domain-containing protein n=1 Tax=Leifsonia sp. ALI-44-B TaxID=1933776 RepID=UPI00097C151E|nr:transporter substrate-binding domain-containing protein [Leifsonia sp. ALI-44-B]ONI61304.1 hypothetical protein ALI44B_12725 [Leifsonia sp. ALI-44-B]
MKKWASIVAAGSLVALVSGCGITVPSDPDGTLDSVRGGELRVGVSPNDDYTVVNGDDVSGIEPEAVRAFAATLDADVDWTIGSEQALVKKLENDEIDLLIAGITDDTPWVDKAGVSRAYAEHPGVDGRMEKHVMLVQLGENAFLSELERFLGDYTRTEG